MGAEHWIWLQSVLGYGSRFLPAVLAVHPNAADIYADRLSDAVRGLSLPARVARNFEELPLEAAERAAESCRAAGIRIVPYDSPEYPPRLRELTDPPAVLYAKGAIPSRLALCGVTLVGTRGASEYGRRAAFSLAYRLAGAGCALVGGVAEGIDDAVYKGTQAAKATETLVLPCGHGRRNLRSKQAMLDRVLGAGGCVLSEYPPDVPVLYNAYPMRNRLLAGLVPVTAVIQAPEKSGALITANAAIQQGREVFAVAGMPRDPLFAGCRILIRDGATPLFDARDIFTALRGFTPDLDRAYGDGGRLVLLYRRAYAGRPGLPDPPQREPERVPEPAAPRDAPKPKPARACRPAAQPEPDRDKEPKRAVMPLSETAAAVYDALPAQGAYLDELVAKTGLTSGRVLSAVTELEVYGLATSAAGGRYTPRTQPPVKR